jgi:hypothetical protein
MYFSLIMGVENALIRRTMSPWTLPVADQREKDPSAWSHACPYGLAVSVSAPSLAIGGLTDKDGLPVESSDFYAAFHLMSEWGSKSLRQ